MCRVVLDARLGLGAVAAILGACTPAHRPCPAGQSCDPAQTDAGGDLDAAPADDIDDPCACHTPPGPECVSPTGRRSYLSPGTCDVNGSCTYPAADSTCASCGGGACALTAGPELRITDAAKASYRVSLVFAGNQFGVAWQDERDGETDSQSEIYFTRLGGGGTRLDIDRRVSNGDDFSVAPSLVWTGNEFGVAWHDFRESAGNAEIFLSRLDPQGAPVASETRITDAWGSSQDPSLVWTGAYRIAWSDDGLGAPDAAASIFVGDLGQTAPGPVDPVAVSSAGAGIAPALVWTGAELAIAWSDDRDGNPEIYFARRSAGGQPLAGEVRVTSGAGSSTEPSLVWTGGEYGLAWSDAGGTAGRQIRFARLDARGNVLGTEIVISRDTARSESPSLVWTGGEYGLVWHETDGSRDIWFRRLGPGGEPLGLPVRISEQSAVSREPSLVWTGVEYALAWHDSRDGNAEIYFRRLTP